MCIVKRHQVAGKESKHQRVAGAAMMVVMLLTLSGPRLSHAASLTGDSRTYAQSSETAEAAKALNGYEYLNFTVRDIGSETVSFHTGGWLRHNYQFQDLGRRTDADLQYSYLRYASSTNNTAVSLGRVQVFEGIAAERIDGVSAQSDLAEGFGISAFGGSPVEVTDVDLPGNDVIYGGRLSHQVGDVYRFGFSALQEEKNSLTYRKEGGFDIWLHPFAKADLTGRSSFNDVTRGWMEHSYGLMLGPFAGLRFDSTAQWIFYDQYFYRSTMNAFLLQPGSLTKHEKARILGEEISWAITDTVLLAADYRNFTYEIADEAHYFGGKLRYSAFGSGGVGVSYHRMRGKADAQKYDEYRFYAYKKAGGFDIAADVIDVVYDIARNGVENAYSASLAAGYAVADSLHLGVDAEYSHNPDFERDVRTFFKVLYHFGAQGGA